MKEEDRMSETTPETSELRERAIAAVHALEAVEADPTVEQYADALLPVVVHEVAAAEQRGLEGFIRANQPVIVAEIERRAEQRGREAGWDQGYTSGHSNAMRRMSDEPNAPTTPNPYRAALAEPAPEERP